MLDLRKIPIMLVIDECIHNEDSQNHFMSQLKAVFSKHHYHFEITRAASGKYAEVALC